MSADEVDIDAAQETADEFTKGRRAALNGDDWTAGEKLILRWQFRSLGHFWTQLFEAMIRADDDNLDRLALGFPDAVEALRDWRFGDLGKRFDDAGLMP